MKPYEVALFKEFLDGKGMVTPFINLFRKYRIKQNPLSVEEYLKNVDVDKAATSAFYWVANSRWGYDYWTKVQKDFNAYVEAHPENDGAEPWWFLHGKCKVLRTNWDADKYWKLENRKTAAHRLGITLPEYIQDADFENDTDENKDELSLLEDFEEKGEKELFDEFTFIDLTPRRQLKPNEISINRRNKKATITFNQTVSKEVRERGGYEYVALMSNKAGDIVLLLNDSNGVSMLDGRVDKDGGNAVINNKELVSRLVVSLDIKNDYAIVNIEEIKKTKDFVAYRVFINKNK